MFDLASMLERVRRKAPLIHCITNFVTVNDCANVILAVGASPSMACDIREAEEAASGAQGLVCNMGAIEDTEAMVLAGRQANRLGIPAVLDPVAAGVTQLRRDCAGRLLKEVHFAAIRGNASEIRFLAGENSRGSGVDVGALDVIREEKLAEAMEMVRKFAAYEKTVIAVSGSMDIVSDGEQTAVIRNGCSTMSRITGSGCMLTSLIGAFCAAMPEEPFASACAAVVTMGLSGEIAEAKRLEKGSGNASFRTDLIDAVFNMTGKKLMEGAKYEIY